MLRVSSNTGNKTRLVIVPTIRVRESQPKAFVSPKPLKQKIIKPAIKTKGAYVLIKNQSLKSPPFLHPEIFHLYIIPEFLIISDV